MTTWADGCDCTFDDECSGTGSVYCTDDLCACDCGGDRECRGCSMCAPDHRDDEPPWWSPDGEAV